MLNLRIMLLAGGLTVATVPAVAVDLPDYGSKNFSPSGETPSYFANEAAPVSARTADTTERDWSVVDEMAPRSVGEGGRSAHFHRGRHGRYAVGQRSARYGAGRYGGLAHAVHTHSAAQTRNASSGRTTTAKHGRTGARHASAAAARYVVD